MNELLGSEANDSPAAEQTHDTHMTHAGSDTFLPNKRSSKCPHCGLENHDIPTPEEAERRILELEAQVQLLTSKATTAVEKLADYEDRLDKSNTPAQTSSTPIPVDEVDSLPALPGESNPNALNKRTPSTGGRFFSFSRNKSYAPKLPPASEEKIAATRQRQALVTAREHELTAEIDQERSKRQQAEEKVGQMSAEIEELSSTLFTQANEMVATERRARAKLEERVKMLEIRDVQKRHRLDMLETEMRRIERLRKTHLPPRSSG